MPTSHLKQEYHFHTTTPLLPASNSDASDSDGCEEDDRTDQRNKLSAEQLVKFLQCKSMVKAIVDLREVLVVAAYILGADVQTGWTRYGGWRGLSFVSVKTRL